MPSCLALPGGVGAVPGGVRATRGCRRRCRSHALGRSRHFRTPLSLPRAVSPRRRPRTPRPGAWPLSRSPTLRSRPPPERPVCAVARPRARSMPKDVGAESASSSAPFLIRARLAGAARRPARASACARPAIGVAHARRPCRPCAARMAARFRPFPADYAPPTAADTFRDPTRPVGVPSLRSRR